MRWIFLCLLAVLATTCGQKGPLTLPEEPQASQALSPQQPVSLEFSNNAR